MRLSHIDVSGFRAFPNLVSLDLNADVVIITGDNGQGKTSVFDAFQWALTGRLSRLGENIPEVLSMYSKSGEAKVTLKLKNKNNKILEIIRSFDGHEQRLTIEEDDVRYQGKKAEVKLLERICPTALLAPDSFSALESTLTRSIYLQQDVLREFIAADTEQERFNIVSELIGAGRIAELHVQLERSKKAWSTITNQKREDLEEITNELAQLQFQLNNLSHDDEVSLSELEEIWKTWWNSISLLEINADKRPSLTSPSASSALDSAVRQLDATKRSLSRREDSIRRLKSELSNIDSISNLEESTLYEQIKAIDEEILSKENNLELVREKLSQERKRLRQLRETREELRTLAQIALRHLNERCPVCTQEYDDKTTRHHLEQLAAEDEEIDEEQEYIDKANLLEEELATLRRTQEKLRIDLNDIQRRKRELRDQEREIWVSIEELGITSSDDSSLIEQLAIAEIKIKNELEQLTNLQRKGEHLASELAKVADIARRREVEMEIKEVKPKVQLLQNEITERELTGNLSGEILDALREATSTIVKTQLEEIEPLLQRIYSRIDPHPAFRSVRLMSTYSYGRGHLMAQINDPIAQVSSSSPDVVLSSSQLNALAVSIFLAFNLGMPNIPLECAILDDPFQSMDDINLLGLVDLLRRFTANRQLIISTHDSRFASLLQRKLRPINETGRSTIISLQGWSREGPEITQADIPLDLIPFKLAELTE